MICEVPGHACQERYEALRVGALGMPVEPAHRFGLTLLLQRGMWAWALAATGRGVPERAAAGSCVVTNTDAMTRLLAEMTRPHLERRSA